MLIDKRGILQAILDGELTKEEAKLIPKFEGSTVEDVHKAEEDSQYHLLDCTKLTVNQLIFLIDRGRGEFKSLDYYKD